ncbi:hypothetical protein SAMN06265375_102233 [Muriicola jejuensis]|uniref:DUF3278 domain-containing protein n=1 Tax=Muriicola jejuensis TaxID=504488 RepID=A0A6P0UKN2_9FLAO|nr:hypothetical protein [Muriicola jejuensis]NER10786.1 hypothetical protein [Muriicola jejuensis]SMP16254.1 hypothetical protein SAMN06265375_102233 [Muriicola jejuensis]
MKNEELNQIWNRQGKGSSTITSSDIVAKAKKQRHGQFLVIGIISTTVVILLIYSFFFATRWNDFSLGLTLMISSLIFRIILEGITLYRKENLLIRLDHKSFKAYLRKHYRIRLGVNYVITPLCFAVYIAGFIKLLPFFKTAFSPGFYNYILISGILSLFFLAWIIARSVILEIRFLKHIQSN